MSNFFLADRIKETSRVQGTGDISLDGVVSGFSSFSDFYASGDVVFYAITDNVKYEIGSGIYQYTEGGSTRSITRNPFRSSQINVGPWYVDGTSNSGPTNGSNGKFYPLWLSRSAALSGVGFNDGPYTSASGITFNEFPGITFYHIAEHSALGVGSIANSGADYSVSGQPVNFNVGLKEVFVTYPGKTAVYNGFGLDNDIDEPKRSGVAFWHNEQILNYTSDLVWDNENSLLGINQPNPQFAIDVGGLVADSIVRASGFIDGGSGILFSGGQLTDTLLTASGGRQYEPFLRNRIGYGAEGVIQLSGVVDQIIDIKPQSVATVFAGAISGNCGNACPDEIPTFRRLVLSDLPDFTSFQTELNFVIQQNSSVDGETENINPFEFIPGMIALYSSSGAIMYDSGILFDPYDNKLMVGGNAAIDIPSYTLDVKGNGTLSAASGWFKHLIFADDLIRIGDINNNTNDGNINENLYVISIGKSATINSTGNVDAIYLGRDAGNQAIWGTRVVAAGKDVLRNSKTVTDVVSIGSKAGTSASELNDAVLIGIDVGHVASGIRKLVAVGNTAVSGAKHIQSGVFIGVNTGNGISHSDYVIGIGAGALVNSSGSHNVVAIGNNALDSSKTLNSVVAIGKSSSQSGIEMQKVVSIGDSSAYKSSGTHNIFVGSNAGIGVSGHNNIEIIASGTSSSFLTHLSNNKLNVGNVIAGDISQGKISIGNPSDASPPGTLVVLPKSNSDAAFIIKHNGTGSSTPYMQMQSGDGTTFYHVTNSGNVITSGYLNPSGGILLEAITPSDWMDSTTNRLYNDEGTLKWNGNPIGGGGSFTSFNFTNGKVGADPITDNQTVIVSGISGVEVQYDPNNNFFRISANELSGVLQDQITAQTYTFYSVASGYGSNNNNPNEHFGGSYLAISGVSGINIDYTDLDDGTNSSGIFTIGYDPSFAYSFNVTNGDVVNDTINNSQTITISGVSGIRAEYDPTNNFFRIGASGLSGVLNATINNSGNFLYGQILQNTASGLAISGIAAYASGQVDGFTVKSATSGITLRNNTYVMDSGGVGWLKNLILNNNDSIFISTKSGVENYPTPSTSQYSVAIGNSAGAYAKDLYDSVVIGNGAGYSASGLGVGKCIFLGYEAGSGAKATQAIAIGSSALSRSYSLNPVAIGLLAGAQSYDNDWMVSIGAGACTNSSGNSYSTHIGFNAGYQSSGNGDSIFIGRSAGHFTRDSNYTVAIGTESMYASTGNLYSNFFGYRAGWQSKGNLESTFIGKDAGFKSSGVLSSICMGSQAGYQSTGVSQSVFIGELAGYESNADNSIFIGDQAGYRSQNHNSISIRNVAGGSEQLQPDFPWASPTARNLLDISRGIQGYIEWDIGSSLHIGKKLDNWNTPNGRDGSDLYWKSALSLTPTIQNSNALKLFLHPLDSDLSKSNQVNGLLECQWKGSAVNSAIYDISNTIINKNGVLQLPVANTVTGTAAQAELEIGNLKIPKSNGVIAAYAIAGHGTGIAICIGTSWYKIGTAVLF